MKHSNIAVFIPHVGCPHQCSFCNQKTISGIKSAPTLSQVDKELQRAVSQFHHSPKDAEIAFFGGSFTAINKEYMIGLLSMAKKYVDEFGLRGIRASTRPDAIDVDILTLLKRYGVTSIELGAQSMNDKVLHLNQRGHLAEQVRESAKLIHETGFELGLQMMIGLYGSTADMDFNTAKQLALLKPTTMRIYPTIVLQGTELAQKYLSGEYLPPSLEQSISLCADIMEFFYEKQIEVIKVGLHASRELEQEMVAGIYHPAFRELCESQIYRNKALEKAALGVTSTVALQVNSSEISKMVGQHRSNLEFFERTWNRKVKVVGNPKLKRYEVKITEQ